MDFTDIVKPGLRGEKTETVSGRNTASAWGSGGLEVYATPSMAALMEGAAAAAVDHLLPEGWSTVGTELSIRHNAASPPGMTVRARGELLEIDRRRLVFRVEAWDEKGSIGSGTHERFIIHNEQFLKKAEERRG
jgi:predicted thioesterase